MSNGINRYDEPVDLSEARRLVTQLREACAAKNAEIADLKHDIEQLQKIATAEATLVGEIAKQVRERLLKLCESKVNVFVTKNEMPEAIKRNKVINECCEAIRTADLTDLTGVK